ncbi:hypothetical protein U471_30620 [Bacillus amyloliquefaciens CC178]|nr:hypothetical protein U471_30620 [Bacillus amyloliquefaciens CC178]
MRRRLLFLSDVVFKSYLKISYYVFLKLIVFLSSFCNQKII